MKNKDSLHLLALEVRITGEQLRKTRRLQCILRKSCEFNNAACTLYVHLLSRVQTVSRKNLIATEFLAKLYFQ